MQPCQRHTDDSSASRESSGSETKGVKSLGEREKGGGKKREEKWETDEKERTGRRERGLDVQQFYSLLH